MTAYTPNLPALITALPGDPGSGPGASPRAPQTEFTRERQVLFLENLSVAGSVRSAAAAAGVSHQTAYRARRATPAFRTAWDAALVVARVSVADTVGCRAIDGVTEPVFYHGEEVATRTRYSDRLLLAHLARLDRLAETPAANAFAEDWDEAIGRFERGEAQPLPQPAQGPDNFSPGPCNTRSMSPADWEAIEDDEEELDCIDWEDEAAREAELDRIAAAMDADRPADAPRLDLDDPDGEVGSAQFDAFLKGVPGWWLVVGWDEDEDGGVSGFVYADTAAAASATPVCPETANLPDGGAGPEEAAPCLSPTGPSAAAKQPWHGVSREAPARAEDSKARPAAA